MPEVVYKDPRRWATQIEQDIKKARELFADAARVNVAWESALGWDAEHFRATGEKIVKSRAKAKAVTEAQRSDAKMIKLLRPELKFFHAMLLHEKIEVDTLPIEKCLAKLNEWPEEDSVAAIREALESLPPEYFVKLDTVLGVKDLREKHAAKDVAAEQTRSKGADAMKEASNKLLQDLRYLIGSLKQAPEGVTLSSIFPRQLVIRIGDAAVSLGHPRFLAYLDAETDIYVSVGLAIDAPFEASCGRFRLHFHQKSPPKPDGSYSPSNMMEPTLTREWGEEQAFILAQWVKFIEQSTPLQEGPRPTGKPEVNVPPPSVVAGNATVVQGAVAKLKRTKPVDAKPILEKWVREHSGTFPGVVEATGIVCRDGSPKGAVVRTCSHTTVKKAILESHNLKNAYAEYLTRRGQVRRQKSAVQDGNYSDANNPATLAEAAEITQRLLQCEGLPEELRQRLNDPDGQEYVARLSEDDLRAMCAQYGAHPDPPYPQ